MSSTYGVPPHSWLMQDDVLTAFDWEVYNRATVK
jgi:hypothetical protein